MATRRAKKEKVARTHVSRTVEERNLENKHIYEIYSTEKASVIDNNNKRCRSPCLSHLENLRVKILELNVKGFGEHQTM